MHPRDLNPRGIGSAGVSGARGGARGDGRRLTLPPMSPAGGLARLVACRPCRPGARRGACLLCRLSTLPLACFLSPIPPTPFPAGRGRFLLYFAGGSAPGTPALNRLRHLQNLPSRCQAGGVPPALPARRALAAPSGGRGGFFGSPADLAVPATGGGACPRRHLLSLPLWYPVGGLSSLPPAYPAFSLLSFPHPPAPFPGGEGGDF